MQLVQVRIDDRLIHGQVVVGWRSDLKMNRILLCSDEVANSDWQTAIYLSAVPDDIDASVLRVEETIETLLNNRFGNQRILLLVDNPKTIVTLLQAGVKIDEVNVGGLHFKPGKSQISPFIFVDQEDIDSFEILHKHGIKLDGRDVPTRPSLDVAKLLNFGNR
jgi:mannose/fructose/sorbose-specific phosphotransferase system IIB component